MVKYNDTEVDQVFTALAHPVRRSILDQLLKSPASVMTLAEPYEISLPAITKHLKVLEKAGLIIRKREGQTHRIFLRPEQLKTAASWIERYKKFWEGQLDQLEKFLQQEDESDKGA